MRLSKLLAALVISAGAASPLCAQDTTPPTIAVVAPVGNSYLSSLASLDGTAADDILVSSAEVAIVRDADGYYWDGAAFVAGETWNLASFTDPAWTYAALPAWVSGSTYTVIGRAVDSSANISAVYSTATFHFDSDLPISGVTTPATGSFPAAFSGISGTAADTGFGLGLVWVKLIRASDNMYWNGATSQWTAPVAWNLAVGSETWTWSGPAEASLTYGTTYFAVVKTVDLAGNQQLDETGSSTFTFTGNPPDTTLPTAALLAPADNAVLNSLTALSGTAADNVAVSSAEVSIQKISDGLYWDGGAWGAAQTWLLAAYTGPAWSYSSVPAWVDGSSYTVVARAADTSGNWTAVYSTAMFTYDVSGPSAGVVHPSSGSVLNVLIYINGTAADNVAVSSAEISIQNLQDGQYWDGSAWGAGHAWKAVSIWPSSWTYTSVPAWVSLSSYSITARAWDAAGNSSSDSALFTYDWVAPTGAILQPANSSVINSLPQISGTAADNMAVSSVTLWIQNASDLKYWQGSSWGVSQVWLNASLWPSSWTYTSVPAWVDNSSYSVTVSLKDLAGNGIAIPYSFHYDTAPPVAVISTPVTGTYSSFPGLQGTAADPHGVALVEVSVVRQSDGQFWNGAAWVGGLVWNASTGTANWSYGGIANGDLISGTTYTFNVRAHDYAGNISNPASAVSSFTYVVPPGDLTSPTVGVMQPSSGSVLNALTQLAGTAADNISVSSAEVSILNLQDGQYWDGSAWGAGPAWKAVSIWPSSWTYTAVPAWVDSSSYVVTGRAWDAAGNSGSSSSAFLYDVTAPAAAITSPVTGTYASFTQLDGTAADPHGVAQVEVSVLRQSDGQYWDGSAWVGGLVWNASTGTVTWTYSGITNGDLASGTTYTFNARARDYAGNFSNPVPAVSSFTYQLAPGGALGPAAFSGVGVSSLTVNWTSTFGAGTTYYVNLSTWPSAAPFASSGTALATDLYFDGLSPNASYYGFVSTDTASFTASGSGATLAEAPSAVDFPAIGYSSATLAWSAGANPADTVFEFHLSTASDFTALTASGPVVGSSVVLNGLAEWTQYYGRVRAVNRAGVRTPYVNAGFAALTQFHSATGTVSGLAGAALGVSSIAWSWSSGTVLYSDLFAYYDGASVFLGTAPFGATGAYDQAGLSPNTPHLLRVAGRNGFSQGPLADSATAYTLAAVPASPAFGAVGYSSADIALDAGANPAGTSLQLWRSEDNVSYAAVYEGLSASYSDPGLAECSPYYYKARARNGAGYYSGFSGVYSFNTQASTPSAASGLAATQLDGARIALSWDPSPSLNAARYLVYYDAGTGTVDYGLPYTIVSATATSWTTPALTAGTSYKFALRTAGTCGTVESNTSLAAAAQAVGVLSGVRAAIKVPQTGKRVKGNSVTIVAELVLGAEAQTAQVRFQYSPAGAGAWADVVPANAMHPNPDTDAPYFVHWDADSMAPGAYDLRAVATDIYGVADPAAPSVTVVIDPVDFDTSESVVSGEQKKEQRINNTVTSTVQAADDAVSLLTKVVIPPGAVTDSTVAVTVINNPASQPAPPDGAEKLNLALKVNLSNGQSQFPSGKTAAVTFSYRDDDGNGIVDGTLASVDLLKIYTASDSGGGWTVLPTSVDKQKKTITADTPHFSFFSVFARPTSGLGNIKIYPVPWQPGSGGRFDAPAVTFSGLPAAARIKIYTINGELVRQLDVVSLDAGVKTWDGLNSSGRKAASGVYIAFIKSGSDERTVKVAVER